jgi:hypothetical protein
MAELAMTAKAANAKAAIRAVFPEAKAVCWRDGLVIVQWCVTGLPPVGDLTGQGLNPSYAWVRAWGLLKQAGAI